MFPKSKRFRSPVSHAPPVGSYNVKTEAKQGTVLFNKSKRFGESKENLPGPCDTSAFLNLSTCSTSSLASNCKSTPRLKSVNKAKLNELQRTIDDLREELDHLREQNILLTTKQNKSATNSEERETQTNGPENADIELMTKELVNLKMVHKVELEQCKADFDLEVTRNMAFKTRITALEKRNQELTEDRDQVEEENLKLQGLADDLRRENLELNEKLELKSQEIKIHKEVLKSAVAKAEEDIEALKAKQWELIKDHEEKLNYATTKKEKEIQDLKITNLELIKNQKEQNDIVATAKKEIQELKATNLELIKNHEEQLSHTKTKAEEMNAKNLELTLMHEEELKVTIAKAEEEFEAINAEAKMLKSEKAEFIKKCELLEHSIKVQEEQQKAAVAKEEQKMQSLQLEKLDLSEKLLSKEQELLAHKEQLKLVEENCEKLKETVEGLKIENMEISQKFNLTENTLQVLEEKFQEAAAKREEEVVQNKAEIESLKAQKLRLTQTMDLKEHEIQGIQEKLKSSEENRCKEIEILNAMVDKEVIKTKACEKELIVCMENMKNLSKSTESLTTGKTDLEHKVQELEERLLNLGKSQENLTAKYDEDKERLQGLLDDLQSDNLELTKKLDLEFVKAKAHEEKYNQCVKKNDENIENYKKTLEDLEMKNAESEKMIEELKQNLEEVVEREHQFEEQLRWKIKFEELQERIEPFKEQLDAFEAEKNFLLSKHSAAQNEVSKLSEQYAKLLGHQNQKQKIHHVLKLKQENIGLKTEVSKLRELCEKQKRNIKQHEKNSARKKFNPSEAFSHSKKDDTQ